MLHLSENYYAHQLKRKIETQIGFQILRFQDCKVLSEILAKNKITISAHTLARFFGLLREVHRPYTSTLNLLAVFVGFKSFALFCNEILTKQADSLSNQLNFSIGEFSFTALELTIQNNDWKSMQLILNSFISEDMVEKNNLILYIENTIRNHQKKDEFLKALTEIHNGKIFLFESFLNEENSDAFTNVGLKLFLDNNSNDEKTKLNKLFIENSKNIYQNNSYLKNDLDLIKNLPYDFDKLNEYQVSRLFELKILISSKENKLIKHTFEIIRDMLKVLPKYSIYYQTRILSRSIKALAFTKRLTPCLEIKEFKEQIINTYNIICNKIGSNSDLIIQLTCHIIKDQNVKILPPQKINGNHGNYCKLRISLEAATALLYAKNPVKDILEKNLRSFAEESGNGWVIGLIEGK